MEAHSFSKAVEETAWFSAPSKSGTKQRNSRQNPCPICHNRSASGKLSIGKCLMLDAVVYCHNVPSDRPANTTPASWLHRLNRGWGIDDKGRNDSQYPIYNLQLTSQENTANKDNKRARAGVEDLARAGQWLLKHCPIAEHHAAALAAEGHHPADYGTLPTRNERSGLARAMVAEFGEKIAAGLPWLIQKKGKAGSVYWDLSGPARGFSLLVPVLDEFRRIVAFQYKPDVLDEDRGKYRWLSGGQVEHGTPLHFSIDDLRLTIDDYKEAGGNQVSGIRYQASTSQPVSQSASQHFSISASQLPLQSFNPSIFQSTQSNNQTNLTIKPIYNLQSTIYNSPSTCLITEGRKKSDMWARVSGMLAVSVSGVDAWAGAGLPLRLKKLGIKEIWVAYDADKTVKPAVLRAEKRLCEQMAAAGFVVNILSWPLELGKGLDDALLRSQESGVRSQESGGNQPASQSASQLVSYRQSTNQPASASPRPLGEGLGERGEADSPRPLGEGLGVRVNSDPNIQSSNLTINQSNNLQSTIYNLQSNTQSPVLSPQSSFNPQSPNRQSSIVNRQLFVLSPFAGAGKFVEVQGESLAARFGAAEALYTLAEARQLNKEQAEGWLARHAFGFGGITKNRLINTSTTGTGKSRAYDEAIARHAKDEKGGRVLILAPGKDNIYERLKQGDMYTELGKIWANQKLHIQLGRQVRPLEEILRNPGDFDCANPEASEAGAMRQNARRVACADCPFGSLTNWQAAYPDKAMPWNCSEHGYISSKKRASEASVVLATKQAYLNGSSQLAEFDYIVIDEDLKPFLKEEIRFSRDHTALWRTAITNLRLTIDDLRLLEPFGKLLDLIDGVMTWAEISASAREGVDKVTASGQWSVVSGQTTPQSNQSKQSNQSYNQNNLQFTIYNLLAEEAERLGLNLEELLEECRENAKSLTDENGRYVFERPFKQDGKRIIPLRAMAELLAALEEAHTQPDKPNRLWLEQDGQGGYFIRIRQLRHNLLKILNGEKGVSYNNHFQGRPALAILNATPEIELDWVLPDLVREGFEVAQYLEVTQVVDGLYTQRDLQNPATRARVQAVIEAVTKEARRPTILGRHAFTPGTVTQPDYEIGVSNPAARYGYFGRDHKATNVHLDSDVLVIYGHYLTPLDEIQADYELFSGKKVKSQQSAVGSQQPISDSPLPKVEGLGVRVESNSPPTTYHLPPTNRTLRTYYWRSDTDGKGLARWCKAHPDPELQKAIEWDYYAGMMQAVGRLRAALRDPEHPAKVVIVGADIVGDLPISQITTVSEVLGQSRITEAQKAALDKGRADWNAERAAMCQQVQHAVLEMGKAGLDYVSLPRLSRYVGLSIPQLIRVGYLPNKSVKVAPRNKRVLPQAIHYNIFYGEPAQKEVSFSPHPFF